MVGQDLRVWLIECNRSPDLTPSTSITKSLTERMFKDFAKMFCEHQFRDINMNDDIKWVGDFYKLINNKNHKELLKLMQDGARKKDEDNFKV